MAWLRGGQQRGRLAAEQRHAGDALCDAFGIELFAERKRVLHSLDVAGLEQLLARPRDERRWS